MNCLKCNGKLVESNVNYDTEELFRSYWFCFECLIIFEASSQSGDYTEEMLGYAGGI